MISGAFHAAIYLPLYNGLVFLVDIVPSHDMGIAVVLLTIAVRIILFPLSRRVVESQKAMKRLTPEIEELKKKYKKNSPEQSQAVFALYKERGVHPFASFGLTLLQLPVLFGLYWVFLKGGFPAVDPGSLYAAISVPPEVNMHFLGLIDMGAPHNILLAALVAISQFAYTRLSMGPRDRVPDNSPVEASFSGDMAKSLDLQARYVFPLMFGGISYVVPAAAPLYWLTSNLFMIAQEYASGRRFGAAS